MYDVFVVEYMSIFLLRLFLWVLGFFCLVVGWGSFFFIIREIVYDDDD